jgi:predicted metal-dependent hydrolase
VIPSKKYFGGSSPYVLTEQGVAMLSSILKSNEAIKINIKIIRAFVAMRRFLSENAGLFQRLEKTEYKLLEHDNSLSKIFKTLENKEIKEQGIFYNGQIFDACKFVIDLIKEAKEQIILIDNYIDENTLTILSNKNKNTKIKIYTKQISKQLELIIKKFNNQYQNLEIKETNYLQASCCLQSSYILFNNKRGY